MANYKMKASKLAKSSYRYTHKISATATQLVELPNGMTDEVAVEIWSSHAALYETSVCSTIGVEGYSAKSDFQFAVRFIQNDPFSRFDFNNEMTIHDTC